MKVLGRFAYHQLLITFEGNEESGTFVVKSDFGSRVEVKAIKDEPTVDGLGRARAVFEMAIHNALLNTSRSDILLYMRHGEGV